MTRPRPTLPGGGSRVQRITIQNGTVTAKVGLLLSSSLLKTQWRSWHGKLIIRFSLYLKWGLRLGTRSVKGCSARNKKKEDQGEQEELGHMWVKGIWTHRPVVISKEGPAGWSLWSLGCTSCIFSHQWEVFQIGNFNIYHSIYIFNQERIHAKAIARK